MQTNPYLYFNGQCEAAFKFYADCLGGRIEAMVTYGEMPQAEQTDPARRNAIVHARMTVGHTLLMGGDAPAEHYHRPQGFSVYLSVETAAEAERIFAALTDGGTVSMPLEQTFWTARFGMATDRFGTPWIVTCEETA